MDSICDINRPEFCERVRFESLVCTLDSDKKVKALLEFVSKKFPKALIEKRKGVPEFEYCLLGFEELRSVGDFLCVHTNK